MIAKGLPKEIRSFFASIKCLSLGSYGPQGGGIPELNN